MGTTYVAYGDNKLEPAPFIGVSLTPTRLNNNEKIGYVYRITVQGKILAYMGSPGSGGVFTNDPSSHATVETVSSEARLAAISRKIEAFQTLFSVDGKKFLWRSANGAQDTYCYPKVINFQVNPDIWFNTADYTIELEAESVYGLNSPAALPYFIRDAQESWDIAPEDSIATFSVRHTLSAQGIGIYSTGGTLVTGAYLMARQYVIDHIGFDNIIVSGTMLRGSYDFGTFTPYNYTVVENTDETNGSYGLTESWILFSGNYRDTWNLSINNITEDAQRTKVISIRGAVQGFYVGLNNQASAYSNALSGWNAVQTGIYNRVSDYITNPVFNNVTSDHDFQNGSISYAYEYDNKLRNSGTFEEYATDRQWGYEDYKTTITVNGTIRGLLEPGEDLSVKYDKANARWQYIQGTLYGRANNAASGAGIILATSPIARNVTQNPIEGSISYAYVYNNRIIPNYEDNYSVSYNYDRSNGIINVGVNGQVQGYDLTATGNQYERFHNALTGLPSDATVFARAYAVSNLVKNSIVTKEIVQQPQAGIVAYSYNYDSRATGCISGVISQVISVSEDRPGRIVAQIPVLGRSYGPVLQDIGTNTARTRRIDIELVMLPTDNICDYAAAYATKPDAYSIISGLRPLNTVQLFLVSDQDAYDITNGRYSRSATWLYEL